MAGENDHQSSATAPRGSMLATLDKMNAQELTGLIQAAEEKRREKLDTAKQELVAEFRARASSLGIQLESLFPQVTQTKQSTPRQGGRKLRSDAGRTLAMRYRSPDGEGRWQGFRPRVHTSAAVIGGRVQLEGLPIAPQTSLSGTIAGLGEKEQFAAPELCRNAVA